MMLHRPAPIPPCPWIYSADDLARYQAAYEKDRAAFDREMALDAVLTLGFGLVWLAAVGAGTYYAVVVIPEMIGVLTK